MNNHIRWRLDLARDLIAHLWRFPNIRAALVGGSVARGYCDAWSDLELLLYWDVAPDPAVRHAVMAAIGASFRFPPTDPGHDSAYLIGDFPVDVWYRTGAAEETALDAVLRDHSIDLEANGLLDTIQSGIPLAGNELIQPWKDRIAVYPEPLAVRFLEHYLPHFHLRHLQYAARRDNPTAFFHTLSDIQCSLFLVLLALNGRWFPTYKWMYQALDAMPVVPENIGRRLRQMYREPPLTATARLRGVLTETLTLVQTAVPQLDPLLMEPDRYELGLTPRAHEPQERQSVGADGRQAVLRALATPSHHRSVTESSNAADTLADNTSTDSQREDPT